MTPTRTDKENKTDVTQREWVADPKEKREQAPAIHTQFCTKIVYHKDNQSQGRTCKKTRGVGIRDSRRGLAEADDGQEAAAQGTFLAVAEEKVAAAGGAQVADKYVWG